MSKNNYICIVLFLSFLAVGMAFKTEKNKQSLPNIIVIFTDDLGYGDVSVYHEDNKIKTVNIDEMAADGIRFTDAHTSSSVCTPSRYSLLTGRYNWRTKLKRGVIQGTSKALIPNSRSTFASVLQDKGYHTAFIGKWHLGWDWALKNDEDRNEKNWRKKIELDNIDFTKPVKNTPNDLGFTYSYGHSGSLDMAPYVYVENGQVTEIPDTITVNKGKYSWWREGPTSKDFIHEDVTPNFFRRGMQYIEEQSKQSNPFLLYLSLPSPHTPILPTEEWAGKSGLNPYGDFMLMIDDYVGQVLQTVENAGIEENTMIIFTSDNGCSPAAKIKELEKKGHFPNSIYRGHKADIFEGGHRVPFLVKWPKVIEKERVSEETICLTDLMATFAEMADYDLKDDEGEDSYSLMPIFQDSTFSAPFREATVHHSIHGNFAIRKDKWKLILCPDSGGWSYPKPRRDTAVINSLPKVQLYDLLEDPKEMNNLEAVFPDKVTELKALLSQYISEGRSTDGVPQENDFIYGKWRQVGFMEE